MFKPSYTKPKQGNYFYNKPQNKAIYGKPTQAGLNVLSNCVGYANGRFNEIIYGETNKKEFKYQLVSNAGSFIKYYCNDKTKLIYTKYPSLGGIMVWASSGAGHVAIVEEISIDGKTIVTSESAYGGKAFYTTKRTNNNGRWGMRSGYTFLGCIVNPYVKTEPINKNKTITYIVKSGDTLSKIAKEYKTTWEKIYNDNKTTIDNEAKKHGAKKNYYNYIYKGEKLIINL